MSRTRRKFSAAFKAKVEIEAIKEHRTISELAQEFDIHPNQVSQWKWEFLERSAQVFEVDKKSKRRKSSTWNLNSVWRTSALAA
jgi:transposase-like protein